MRTWVLGDSIVRSAGGFDNQLRGGGKVLWHGQSGARVEDIVPMLLDKLHHHPFPHILIIHVGTNNILEETISSLRKKVTEALTTIRQHLPFTKIIWSDILPRLGYSKEKTPRGGKTCTININKRAHTVCKSKAMGGNAYVVSHSMVFNPKYRNVDGPIFKYDCTHLTHKGNDLFRRTLSNALRYFNSNPGDFCYPPGSVQI